MKFKNEFITNSSSVNFVICNISDETKTVLDFFQAHPEILEIWNWFCLSSSFRYDDWVKEFIPTDREITVNDLSSSLLYRKIGRNDVICLEMTSEDLEDPVEIILYILSWHGKIGKGSNSEYIYRAYETIGKNDTIEHNFNYKLIYKVKNNVR